jgi:hypothetical protein
MTVEAIKDAIQHLPEDERHSLASWLNEMEYDDWDKQMAKDLSAGGRGAEWARQLKQEAAQANVRSMEEGFRQRRGRRS